MKHVESDSTRFAKALVLSRSFQKGRGFHKDNNKSDELEGIRDDGGGDVGAMLRKRVIPRIYE